MLGNQTTEFLDEYGEVARSIDVLWQYHARDLQQRLELTSVQTSGGSSSIAYNSVGNPITTVDPLGQQTTATYTSPFNEVTSITNPLGQSLNYAYDPTNGNLESITYPDGSSQQYADDATGQVTQFINRDGQAVAYTYNADGMLTSEQLPRRHPGHLHL